MENSLNWYIKNIKEKYLLTIQGLVDPSKYKKTINQRMEDAWKQNALHVKLVNDKEGVVDWDKSLH